MISDVPGFLVVKLNSKTSQRNYRPPQIYFLICKCMPAICKCQKNHTVSGLAAGPVDVEFCISAAVSRGHFGELLFLTIVWGSEIIL